MLCSQPYEPDPCCAARYPAQTGGTGWCRETSARRLDRYAAKRRTSSARSSAGGTTASTIELRREPEDVDVVAVLVLQSLDERGALVLRRVLDLVVVDRVDRRLRPITAICAVGSASVQSGSNAGPLIAYSPAPYALRRITEMRGTCACASAAIILAPWRMIPWRSTAVPIMNPGTSARNSSGTLNASQHVMKRVALSAESTKSTPPLKRGCEARMPTT